MGSVLTKCVRKSETEVTHVHVTVSPTSPLSSETVELLPVTGGVVMRALFDFPAVDDGCPGFEKGELLRADLDTLQEGWLIATRVNTGDTGKIPKSYVCNNDDSLESQDWWLDVDAKDSRRESEIVLLLPVSCQGTFLVRPSSDASVYAVLSVRYDDPKTGDPSVVHYKMQKDDDDGVFVDDKRHFPDVHELIQHYSRQADGLCTKLTEPYPRIQPVEGFNKLEIGGDSLELIHKIGNGRTGTVFTGKLCKRAEVAVRTLDSDKTNPQAAHDYALFMHRVRHKNLVSLLGLCTGVQPGYFVMEYMPHGSLLDFLRQDQGNLVKFPILVKMAAQIADGMAYLESNTITHRDLRAAKALLGQRYNVKVAGISLDRVLEEDPFMPNAIVNIKWMAPEVALYLKYTVKSDVWAFGIVLYELVTHGLAPYSDMHDRDILQMVIERQYRMEKPSGCPDVYYDTMKECWHADPSRRPTFEYLQSFFGDYATNTEEKYRIIADA